MKRSTFESIKFDISNLGPPMNSPRSKYLNSSMTSRLSDHFSLFGTVFFVLNSLLGIARQSS